MRSHKATKSSAKRRRKLSASKFRWLNETLYTSESSAAVDLVDPELFEEYHKGFSEQVSSKWPKNPVEEISKRLAQRFDGKSIVIADFGCGEAYVARNLTEFKVHSFDLCESEDGVVVKANVCDSVPLCDESCDVGVFSLALMGLDYQNSLVEMHRVLKLNATLYVAEVRSRTAPKGVEAFVTELECFGFKLKERIDIHDIFVTLELMKIGAVADKRPPRTLKACSYKPR